MADAPVILAVLFLIVGALYASVGHAGASGYLAVMALMGVDVRVERRSGSGQPSLRPSTSPVAIPVMLSCGAAIGFVARLTGTGDGILLSPLLLTMNSADIRRTAASSLFILVNSLAELSGLVSAGWTPPE